ncbi:hypothetical protein [Rodentibacter caecimuris]|uniref:hypothetical protein n=1 Tax=Rodentibacter caecimuris TaxID=1796644 RepID=UPI001F379E52|nr:hypothetical protein [Rodentibacter heylii]
MLPVWGGEFKGVKINEVRKDFKGPKTPNKSSLETNKHIEKEIKAARKNAENAISSKGLNELRGLSEAMNKISNSPKYTFNQESAKKRYTDIKDDINKRIAELESKNNVNPLQNNEISSEQVKTKKKKQIPRVSSGVVPVKIVNEEQVGTNNQVVKIPLNNKKTSERIGRKIGSSQEKMVLTYQ